MKIGLITFHNALNYGAALQVFATQQAIQKMSDVECEIVDYVNDHRKNAYNMRYHISEELKKRNFGSALKFFAGSVFMSIRRKKFQKFYSKKLNTTKKKYTTNKELEKLNNKYDKFVVGSDQVWNYTHNGKDFAFFLNFVHNSNKKISYASSFGLVDIPIELKDEYTENLEAIKHLSTREEYGVNLIKQLTGKNAEHVLDPVFLLSKNEWINILKEKRQKKNDYIFSYTNQSGQLEEFTNLTDYPVANYKIHKLTRNLTVKDFISPQTKVAYSMSPTEFIDTILHSKLVVSASFHCIAMAIILNVPFVAILSGDSGRDERIINILKITELEDRILNEDMTVNDVNKSIDFKRAEHNLEAHRNKSISFLKSSIYSE